MKNVRTALLAAITVFILLPSNVLGIPQRGVTKTEKIDITGNRGSRAGQDFTGSQIGKDLTGPDLGHLFKSIDDTGSHLEDGFKVSKPGIASFSGTTRQGLSNKKVREIQEALRDAECDPGPVDGRLGSQTRAAIRKFQRLNGLTVDGVPGPKTAATLGIEL